MKFKNKVKTLDEKKSKKFRELLLLLIGIIMFMIPISVAAQDQVTGVRYVPDCNDPDTNAICTELSPTIKYNLTKNGYPYYLGHDEPSAEFISIKPGSANNMQWRIQLPKEPIPTQDGGNIANFELFPAFWFGLSICDPNSFPFGPCTPDSDTNDPNNAGSAFLELQFYPPGMNKVFNGDFDDTKWSARLTITSLENNNICNEPQNFVAITTNGNPNGLHLQMSDLDELLITIRDTPDGLETDINDLKTGEKGFIVASAANGFKNTDRFTCAKNPFSFHPEYSSATAEHLTPWTRAGNTDIAFEIGHWELCGDAVCSIKPDNDADDSTTTIIRGLGGAFNITIPDSDFDGTSYNSNWPDGTPGHPTMLQIESPDHRGFGPLSTDGSTYSLAYSKLQFSTSVQHFEIANFYPFYSQAGLGPSCTLNFGDIIPFNFTGEVRAGTTTNDFDKTAQYFASPRDNPCLNGKFDFFLSATPLDLSILVGNTATYDVTATMTSGFFDPEALPTVLLTASGVPSGATSSFTFSPIIPSIDGTKTKLNIVTSSGVAIGDSTITIQGIGQGTGTGVFNTVVVNLHILAVRQVIPLIINKINTFQSNGILNSGQANSLISKLDSSEKLLNSRESKAACNILNAFIKEIRAYIKSGKLTQEQADSILKGSLGVKAIETSIPC